MNKENMSFFEKGEKEAPKTGVPESQTIKPSDVGKADEILKPSEPLSIGGQVSLLATKYSKPEAELTAKIVTIKTEMSVGDLGALAILKSQLGTGQGAQEVGKIVVRCISVGGPRTATSSRDQSTYVRSDIDFIAVREGTPQRAALALYGEDADLVSKFFWGNVYEIRVSSFTRDEELFFRAPQEGVLEVIEIPQEDERAKVIPTFQDMAKNAVQTLDQAPRLVGQMAVFSGRLSKHIETPTRGYMGFEISDGTIMEPYACWINEPLTTLMDQQRVPLGSEIWVYSWVSQDEQGKIRFSVKGVYPPVKTPVKN